MTTNISPTGHQRETITAAAHDLGLSGDLIIRMNRTATLGDMQWYVTAQMPHTDRYVSGWLTKSGEAVNFTLPRRDAFAGL